MKVMIKYGYKSVGCLLLFVTSLFITSCQKDADSNSNKLNLENEALNSEEKNRLFILDVLENEKYFSEATALGMERSTKPELKKFSKTAHDLHVKNLENTMLIVKEKGIVVPEKLSKDLNDKLYKLTVSNSTDFDKYYQLSITEDYKIKLDSLAKFINEENFSDSTNTLIEISTTYNKNLEQLEAVN